MREELTKLLRSVPFVSFVVHTRDGLNQPVINVEVLSVGKNGIAYTDQQGFISLIPYTAIDRISTRNSPELA
jgi:hypothetical protein